MATQDKNGLSSYPTVPSSLAELSIDERLKKNGGIVCPRCLKNPANFHPIYGVLVCDVCKSQSISPFEGRRYRDKIKERFALPNGQVLEGSDARAAFRHAKANEHRRNN